MRRFTCMLWLAFITMAGCVHMNETSEHASKEQIQAHLSKQLHCQRLELQQTGKDAFTGAGRNETGEFTLRATREGQKIAFHGAYSGPGQGTFSGSASWSKSLNAGFGIHKVNEFSQDSLGVP